MTAISTRTLHRRQFIAALGAAALSGCAHDSTYDLIKASFAGPAGGSAAYPMTPEQVEQLPYATLGVRVGSNPAAVMVLAEQRQDQLIWVSKNKVVFVTEGARLVQTAGLGRDLARQMAVGDDPLLDGRPAEAAQLQRPVTRLIDLRDPDEFSVPAFADLQVLGPETIEIMAWPRATIHLRETLHVERWQWTAKNDFWIDARTGRLWRSVSQYCPSVPPIRLEVLKPVA